MKSLIERLKEKVSTEWVNGNDRKLFTEIIQTLELREAEIARKDKLLAEAKKYSSHKFDCKHLGPNHECSCGWNEWLAALEAEVEK